MRARSLMSLARALAVSLLAALFSVQPVAAQDAEPRLATLAPATTPSPRDAVAEFRRALAVIDRHFGNADKAETRWAALRVAAATMDFGATINGKTPGVAIRRVLLLHEILARSALPPLEQIPGAEEVAAAGIADWTIPGTRLQITRIEEGVRQGEFVFSAATVSRLGTDYRRIRTLPYLRGERGFYEDFIGDENNQVVREREIASLFGELDLSSPRAIFESFLINMNRSFSIIQEARTALAADPPSMDAAEARQAEARARSFLLRAASVLDLSRVPKAEREQRAIETALMLKEILDRLPSFPFVEAVPDEAMVAAARGVDIDAADGATIPFTWRIPRTSLVVAAVTEGPHIGDFKITPETVASIPGLYEKLRHLPYRAEPQGFLTSFEYSSPQPSPGFYEYYIASPGYLLPEATAFGQFILALPDGFKKLYFEQTLWQWIALVLVWLLAVALTYLVFRIIHRMVRRLKLPWGSWLSVTTPLIASGILNAALEITDNTLNVTGNVLTVVRTAGSGVLIGLIVWAVWRVFAAIAETIIAATRVTTEGIDASLVRIAAGVLAFVAALVVAVQRLDDIGVDVVPLLAGLGVGGLATALAIRPTLENLIGGLLLYIDKPVRVGDYCSFGGFNGTIEAIGIRSTHVRGLDRTVIAVPNSKLVDMEITNYARCDRMLIRSLIGVRYETAPDQLRYLLASMREMFHAHPMIDRETVRVRMAGFGASSQDIDIRVFVKTREWNEFYAVREDVFLRISDLVAAAGTGFAFPSQTLYLTRDQGIDTGQGATAVAEVEKWRQSGDLPFPRLRGGRMNQLEGTLDYPPHGSSEADRFGVGQHIAKESLSDEGDATVKPKR